MSGTGGGGGGGGEVSEKVLVRETTPIATLSPPGLLFLPMGSDDSHFNIT